MWKYLTLTIPILSLNIVVWYLALLLHIWELTSSNLTPYTASTNNCFDSPHFLKAVDRIS